MLKKIDKTKELGVILEDRIIEENGNKYRFIKFNKKTKKGVEFTRKTIIIGK